MQAGHQGLQEVPQVGPLCSEVRVAQGEMGGGREDSVRPRQEGRQEPRGRS